MQGQHSWRPAKAGHVALFDSELAKIGFVVVVEAHAKSSAASALRVLEALSPEQWVKLERTPVSEITQRIIEASKEVDAQLEECAEALEAARLTAHELRHIIVHSAWGEGREEGPASYDYGRRRLLSTADIQAAMEGCAEMKRAAHSLAYRVAELVAEGRYPERPDGPGLSIRVSTRTVRL